MSLEVFNTVKPLVAELQKLVEVQESKPTKANSKRIRDAINAIQKVAVKAKKELVEQDKKGW